MTEWGRRFILESPAFQDVYDQLGRDRIDDVRRVGFVRSLEELCTFSSLINRTRRRDIGGGLHDPQAEYTQDRLHPRPAAAA